jgi:hypothetical protein
MRIVFPSDYCKTMPLRMMHIGLHILKQSLQMDIQHEDKTERTANIYTV